MVTCIHGIKDAECTRCFTQSNLLLEIKQNYLFVERWVCEREKKKFGGTPDFYYYCYDIIEPKDVCCSAITDLWKGSNLDVRYDGNNTFNQKVIGMSFRTGLCADDFIPLNFCPKCGEAVLFKETTPITVEQRKENLERRNAS